MPNPTSFREWLTWEIAYLESIKLTDRGEGGLYRLRQALTEFDTFEAARHGPEERPDWSQIQRS